MLIESFREGTPVIARRLGPFPEIVETANAGVLFDDTPGLIAGMRHLQASPAYRAELGENGRTEFERRWSDDVVIPAYLDIVRRAAERKRSAAVAN